MEVRSSGKRPPSYSDSFLFLPEASEPLVLRKIDTPIHHNNTSLSLNSFSTAPPPEEQTPTVPYTTCERWNSRILSFSLHILLISLFETIFFVQFISVSEDSGLQSTLDGYITNILTSCNQWSPNQTVLVNDILSVLINTTEVTDAYETAVQERYAVNYALQVKSWLYVATLVSSTCVLGCIGKCVPLRLAWKRILMDSLSLRTRAL
jgi:hypothetical protein